MLVTTVNFILEIGIVVGVYISLLVWFHQRKARARARSYLKRVLALTGATRQGFCYVLDVGNARFHVREGCVERLPLRRGVRVTRGQTCFYPNHEMPAPEIIATALLQLKNNPSLFDRWVLQCGAYKPDGTLFNEPTERLQLAAQSAVIQQEQSIAKDRSSRRDFHSEHDNDYITHRDLDVMGVVR